MVLRNGDESRLWATRENEGIREFCDRILKVSDVLPPSAGVKANESSDIFDTELIRVLNMVPGGRGEPPDNRLFRRLSRYGHHQAVSSIVNDVKESMASHVGAFTLDDNDPALDNVYGLLSSRYHKYLLNPLKNGGPFERRVREIRYVRADYLKAPGVERSVNRIARLLEKFAERTNEQSRTPK